MNKYIIYSMSWIVALALTLPLLAIFIKMIIYKINNDSVVYCSHTLWPSFSSQADEIIDDKTIIINGYDSVWLFNNAKWLFIFYPRKSVGIIGTIAILIIIICLAFSIHCPTKLKSQRVIKIENKVE